MPSTSPEARLIGLCLRRALSARDSNDSMLPLLAGIDWHRLLWLGRAHDALPPLFDALKPPSIAGQCPPAIIDQLRSFHEVSQLRSLAHARELCQLQDLFDRERIPAMPVAPWMAAQCGGQRPDLIATSSLFHFWVPVVDLARAREALSHAGHPLKHDPEKLVRPGHSPVLLDTGFDGHPAPSCFWQKASPWRLGGRTFLRLAPPHWLLVRMPRRATSEKISLGRAAEIVSLASLLSDTDWPEMLAEAARFDLRDTIIVGLVACHQALEMPLPSSLAKLLAALPSPQSPAPARLLEQEDVAAPFLPTPPLVVERMLALAGTGPGDFVCDLGCGDGRILIKAAQNFGARGKGVDLDPVRIGEATGRASSLGVSDRVSFECGDLFAAQIADATVVTCYLLPQLQPRLHAKLIREAKPGTRIVSHDYVFPDWPPEKTEIIRTAPLKVSQIYLWRIA